jgi:Ca-activated chloride channel homolog
VHFGNPQLLWLLLAWPPLLWLGQWSLAWRRRLEQRLGQPALLGRLHPASVVGWRRRRLGLLSAAVLLLIVAAARPQYGQIEQTLRSMGVNVLVAMDCSASMRARDAQPTLGAQSPSRLDWAKQSLQWIIRQIHGDRIGIISFAGDAFLQCPLTLDYDLAGVVLDALDSHTVSRQGTDLGRAIDVASEAFAHGAEDGGKALVLITDGEDNEGHALEATRRAAAKGIVIYAIGVGSERGAPITGDNGQFMADKSGAKVNSQLRMDALEAIAKETGGVAYQAGTSPGIIAEKIAERIQGQEQAEMESRRQIMYQDRFQWFLWPALLLIVWALLSRPEATRLAGAAAVRAEVPAGGNQASVSS